MPIGRGRLPHEGIAVSEDGLVAFRQISGQFRQVYVYDTDGRRRTIVGGLGEGPGEFSNPHRLGWLADSLWVFTPGLEPFKTRHVPQALERLSRAQGVDSPAAFPVSAMYPRRLLGGDTILAEVVAGRGALVPDSLLDHRILAHLSRNGRVSRFARGGPREGPDAVDPPHRTVWEASPNGSTLVWARATLTGEHRGTIKVSSVTAQGVQVFSERFPFDPEPISGQLRDSIIEVRRAAWDHRIVPTLRAMGGEEPFPFEPPAVPPVYPPLIRLVVDLDGRTWLELGSLERPHERLYVVISPSGEELARLTLPEGTRVVEAKGDQIWTLERDEWDVESVVRSRLVRPPL